MYKKKQRNLESENFEAIVANEIEIVDDKKSVSKLIVFLRSIANLMYYLFFIVALEVAVLSVVIFFKIRSDQLDVYFARDLFIKNLKNISFSDVAIGWDFDYNKLAVILNNVVQNKVLLHEVRMYPKIKDLLHFKLNIEKIAIINPKIELNCDDGNVLINLDFANNFDKKNKLMIFHAEVSKILDYFQTLYLNNTDVSHGHIIIKNKNFGLAQIENLNIQNDDKCTNISMILRNKTGSSKLAFIVEKLNPLLIKVNFENLNGKYVQKFVKLPSFINDIVLNGSLQFNWVDFYHMGKGSFDILCSDVVLTMFSKKYKFNKIKIDGMFNEYSMVFNQAAFFQDKSKCEFRNVEYEKSTGILSFQEQSTIAVNNFPLTSVKKNATIPFDIESGNILAGRFYLSGKYDLQNKENTKITVKKYDATFNNLSANLNEKFLLKKIAGKANYEQKLFKMEFNQGFLDEAKIVKNSLLVVKDGNIDLKLNATLPIRYFINNEIYRKNILLNSIGELDGNFSGRMDLSCDQSGTMLIKYLNGNINATNNILKRNYLSIFESKIKYENAALTISGFLKENRTLSFKFNLNDKMSGNFEIIGDINTKLFYLLGLDTSYIEGFANVILSGEFTDQFCKIITKADLTNVSLHLFDLLKIKSGKEKGILLAESIIRDKNFQNHFDITTPEKLMSGSFIAIDSKIVQYDFICSEFDKDTSFNLAGRINDDLWTVDIRGKNLLNVSDFLNFLKINSSKTNVKLIFRDSIYDKGIKFSKLVANVILENGLIQKAKIEGNLDENRVIFLEMSKDNEEITDTNLVSNDAGSVLKLLDVNDEMLDGNVRLKMTSNQDKSLYNGHIHITNFSVNNSKYIANLLSLTTPLGAAAANKIHFNLLSADFNKNNKFLKIKNGQIIGPSIWLTITGIYNTESRNLKMLGVITPMHTYITQKQLLISDYLITGTLKSPIIEVSPLLEISKENLLKKFNANNYGFIFN